MNISLHNRIGLITVLLMVLAFFIFPETTLAREIASDYLGGPTIGGLGGGMEGDPLDSNDYGSDGSGDGEIHECSTASPGSSRVIIHGLKEGWVLFLQIDIIRGVPVFSFYLAPGSGLLVEANDVR